MTEVIDVPMPCLNWPDAVELYKKNHPNCRDVPNPEDVIREFKNVYFDTCETPEDIREKVVYLYEKKRCVNFVFFQDSLKDEHGIRVDWIGYLN